MARALARHGMNLFGDAIADYDKTISLVPQHFVAHYNRGLLLALVGSNNKAIDDFSFVINKEPDNVMAIYNRALLRKETGDYRGATADFTEIIRQFPNFTYGYYARAECRRKYGDVRGALNDESVVARANLDMFFGKSSLAIPSSVGDKTTTTASTNTKNSLRMPTTTPQGRPTEGCSLLICLDVCRTKRPTRR